jgi:hypothetical protein
MSPALTPSQKYREVSTFLSNRTACGAETGSPDPAIVGGIASAPHSTINLKQRESRLDISSPDMHAGGQFDEDDTPVSRRFPPRARPERDDSAGTTCRAYSLSFRHGVGRVWPLVCSRREVAVFSSTCWALLVAGCLLADDSSAEVTSTPLGSQPVPPATDEASPEASAEPRSISGLRVAIRDALRQSTRVAQPDHEVVVPKLIELFHEVALHPDLPRAEKRTLRGSIRTRLLQIEDILRRRLVRAETDAKRKPADPASRTGNGERESAEAKSTAPATVYSPATIVLAQQGNVAGGNVGGQGLSGPGWIDRGWQLVELIRATVAPDTWDVNGGNGSIYYYRPLNVMVIRQTQAVHEEIGGVLNQLRRSSP